MRILRILSKEEDYQTKWYSAHREEILAKEKEKRVIYNEKKQKEVNEIVYEPQFPVDNVLTFN